MRVVLYLSVISTLGLVGETSARLFSGGNGGNNKGGNNNGGNNNDGKLRDGSSCPFRKGTYSGMSAVTAEGRKALSRGVYQGPGNLCESAVFEMGPSRSEGDCEVVLVELCSSPGVGFSVYFDECRVREAAGAGSSFSCDGPFPGSTVTGTATDSYVEWNIRDIDGILLSSNAGTASGITQPTDTGATPLPVTQPTDTGATPLPVTAGTGATVYFT